MNDSKVWTLLYDSMGALNMTIRNTLETGYIDDSTKMALICLFALPIFFYMFRKTQLQKEYDDLIVHNNILEVQNRGEKRLQEKIVYERVKQEIENRLQTAVNSISKIVKDAIIRVREILNSIPESEEKMCALKKQAKQLDIPIDSWEHTLVYALEIKKNIEKTMDELSLYAT
jgi:hypothetical protein